MAACGPLLASLDAARLAELEAAASYWGITKAVSSDRIAQEEGARDLKARGVSCLADGLHPAVQAIVEAAIDQPATLPASAASPYALLPLPSWRVLPTAPRVSQLLGLAMPPATPTRIRPRFEYEQPLDYCHEWALAAFLGHIDTPQKVQAAATAPERVLGHCALAGALLACDLDLAAALVAANPKLAEPVTVPDGLSGPVTVSFVAAAAALCPKSLEALAWATEHGGVDRAASACEIRAGLAFKGDQGALAGCAPPKDVEQLREAYAGAAAGGHVEVLKWLRAQDPDKGGWDSDFRTSVALGAAVGGHVHVLEWLASQINGERSGGLKGDLAAEAADVAMDAGQLRVLQWLFQHAPMDNADKKRADVTPKGMAERAARTGKVDVLQWVAAAHSSMVTRQLVLEHAQHEATLAWASQQWPLSGSADETRSLWQGVLNGKRQPALRWLLARKVPLPKDLLALCAQRSCGDGDRLLFSWGLRAVLAAQAAGATGRKSASADWRADPALTNAAAQGGALALFQWLLSQGCKLDHALCERTVLRSLHSQKDVVTGRSRSHAVQRGLLATDKWLHIMQPFAQTQWPSDMAASPEDAAAHPGRMLLAAISRPHNDSAAREIDAQVHAWYRRSYGFDEEEGGEPAEEGLAGAWPGPIDDHLAAVLASVMGMGPPVFGPSAAGRAGGFF